MVISVGTVMARDLKLEIGAASEQVTVEAGAEVVQTTESSVSQLVDRRTWEQMPLQIRNQNSFIELVAGAVPQDGSGTNRGAEVNGTRSGAGSYLVEGADNNEQGQGGRGQISPFDKGGASTSISPDAIQEYRVITNTYSAEYGKGGGFITDTVLKSGTNQWHGSAFEYNRIQALVANDWFSNLSGNKDRLVRNQFGGSIGGPIVKDKTFFYGTAELHRVRYSTPYGTADSHHSALRGLCEEWRLRNWAETSPTVSASITIRASRVPGRVPRRAMPRRFSDSYNRNRSSTRCWRALSSTIPLVTTGTEISTARGRRTLLGTNSTVEALAYPVPAYGTVNLADPQHFNEARWSVKFDHSFSAKDTINGVYLFQDGTYRRNLSVWQQLCRSRLHPGRPWPERWLNLEPYLQPKPAEHRQTGLPAAPLGLPGACRNAGCARVLHHRRNGRRLGTVCRATSIFHREPVPVHGYDVAGEG